MTLEIAFNGDSEIVTCPKDTLFVGFSYKNVNKINVFNAPDDGASDDSVEIIEKTLSDDSSIRLYCYKANYASHPCVLEAYHGMQYFDFESSAIHLTITIV